MDGKAWICALILGLLISGGVFLRYPTDAHIHGGEDHGSYFNIAAWVAKHGTYSRHDQILEDAFSKKWPFAFNLVWNTYVTKNRPQEPIPGEFEGERYVGGFTIKDRKKGNVIPQFYPLTSLLLASSYWLFGGKGTCDILPIFGILSVLSGALLTYRIWKNMFVSGLVFVALLVSGLEVFFSTFPVSEIISQYFIISGIWLLLWSMEDRHYSLPVLAGLNFAAALFNHLTTIFYLAPVALFFIMHRISCHDTAENKSVLIFYYTFVSGTIASLISARIYNGYYVYRNLKENMAFLESLQINGTFLLLFASVFIVALLPLIFNISNIKQLKEIPPLWIKRTVVIVMGLITLLIIAKTSLYELDLISLGEIKYTYFSSITSHISPIGWLALIWGLFMAIFTSKIRLVLFPVLAFLLPSFLFLYFQFKTGYQWYFNRYYVKEWYPLAIIFIAYGIYRLSRLKMLRGGKGKIVAIILGLSLVAYSAYPNVYLFKRPFLDGAYDNMLRLNSKFPNKSIILLVQGRDMYAPPDSELRLSIPLVYSFDHDVIWLPLRKDLARIAGIVRYYLGIYQRPIYLVYVGAQPLPEWLLPNGAKLVTNQLNEFRETESVYHLPKKQRNICIYLHLYELPPIM